MVLVWVRQWIGGIADLNTSLNLPPQSSQWGKKHHLNFCLIFFLKYFSLLTGLQILSQLFVIFFTAFLFLCVLLLLCYLLIDYLLLSILSSVLQLLTHANQRHVLSKLLLLFSALCSVLRGMFLHSFKHAKMKILMMIITPNIHNKNEHVFGTAPTPHPHSHNRVAYCKKKQKHQHQRLING